jgi:hypothetical protein
VDEPRLAICEERHRRSNLSTRRETPACFCRDDGSLRRGVMPHYRILEKLGAMRDDLAADPERRLGPYDYEIDVYYFRRDGAA